MPNPHKQNGNRGGNVPLLMEPIAIDARHADDVVRITEKAPTLEARDYKGGYLPSHRKSFECGRDAREEVRDH